MNIIRDINTCLFQCGVSDAHDWLYDEMSMYVEGYQFTPLYRNKKWDGKHHFYSKKTNKFPSGLLNHVLTLFRTNFDIDVPVDDIRLKPDEMPPFSDKLHGITLRDYQNQASDAMIARECCIVKAATNAGKTEAVADVIRRLGQRTVFIVDRKELFHQTADTLRTRLGLDVGMIGDGYKTIEDVTVVMPQTLIKYHKHKTSGTKTLGIDKDFKELLTYPVLVHDECDNISDLRILWLVKHSKAYWRYAMSGTPLHNDEVTNMELIGQYGEVAFEITNSELIRLGYSSKPTCFFYTINSELSEKLDYETSYKINIVGNDIRNNAIVRIVRSAAQKQKQVLVIVQEIEHGVMLASYLDAPFIHGGQSTKIRIGEINKFKAEDTNILIASTILDRGLNISNIDVLVLAAGGKSTKRLLQRIGRGLRKKQSNQLTVVDFIDDIDSYLMEHSSVRYETVREEGFQVKALTDSNLDEL